MRQLDKKFIETIMYLTGDDEKAASKTTSESFFGMLNRFIEIFIKAIPVPPTSDAGKDKRELEKNENLVLVRKSSKAKSWLVSRLV
jgi:hypothetical protein